MTDGHKHTPFQCVEHRFRRKNREIRTEDTIKLLLSVFAMWIQWQPNGRALVLLLFKGRLPWTSLVQYSETSILLSVSANWIWSLEHSGLAFLVSSLLTSCINHFQIALGKRGCVKSVSTLLVIVQCASTKPKCPTRSWNKRKKWIFVSVIRTTTTVSERETTVSSWRLIQMMIYLLLMQQPKRNINWCWGRNTQPLQQRKLLLWLRLLALR